MRQISILFFCFLLTILAFFEIVSIGMFIPLSLVLNDPNFLFNFNQILNKFNIQLKRL